MKTYLPIIASGIALFFLSKMPEEKYNAFVYLLFILFIIFFIKNKMKELIRLNRSKICKGIITDYVENIQDDINMFDVYIRFSSPVTEKEYVIKEKMNDIPKNKEVEIVFNESNPSDSKIYSKPNKFDLVLFFLILSFYLYSFFKIIIR